MTGQPDRDPWAPPAEPGPEEPRPVVAWGPPPTPGAPPFGSPQPQGRGSFGAARPASGAVERGGVWALFLGIGGLLMVIFPPGGILFGALAIRAGVKARRRATASHGAAPGAALGIGTGIAAIVASCAVLTVVIIFFDELRTYQDCMSGANTRVAEERCWSTLTDELGLNS